MDGNCARVGYGGHGQLHTLSGIDIYTPPPQMILSMQKSVRRTDAGNADAMFLAWSCFLGVHTRQAKGRFVSFRPLNRWLLVDTAAQPIRTHFKGDGEGTPGSS